MYTHIQPLGLLLIISRLYSEKAYVLSRGFVRQALASPPEGLQDEIRHYYYTTGHLKNVVDHAKALMEKEADVQNGSEGSARWDSDVIGSLTAGAKLSLKVCHHPTYHKVTS
jgi:ubiquitin-conjugating enzyme E2 O